MSNLLPEFGTRTIWGGYASGKDCKTVCKILCKKRIYTYFYIQISEYIKLSLTYEVNSKGKVTSSKIVLPLKY